MLLEPAGATEPEVETGIVGASFSRFCSSSTDGEAFMTVILCLWEGIRMLADTTGRTEPEVETGIPGTSLLPTEPFDDAVLLLVGVGASVVVFESNIIGEVLCGTLAFGTMVIIVLDLPIEIGTPVIRVTPGKDFLAF